eukprot:TRINITY_DN949_c0_g1_i3.p1 TRINITY_DN949_c0_g1~~TRINITY_DN949_c0_g1_i3.p1  ORF type:complete len:333 (+),score=40.66 TRINITY_DN949_c0_g1_i3:721-1719(+)
MDISRDCSLIAAGYDDCCIKLWDLNEGKSVWSQTTQKIRENGRENRFKKKTNLPRTEYELLVGHSGSIFGLSFAPDNQYLLSSSEDTTIRLWSMETKTCLVVFKGHYYPVWSVRFSPMGFYFATCSHDGSSRLWSTNFTTPHRIYASSSDVNCVEFHPNCNYLVTGSNDRTVKIYDLLQGLLLRTFYGHTGPIFALAVSPDGRYLASAGEDKTIIMWDLSTYERVATLKGHKGTIWSLDFSQEATILASGGADNTVRLWDIIGATTVFQRFKNKEMDSDMETDDSHKKNSNGFLLETFYTKQTPVFKVLFTRRNLLMAGGAFIQSTDRSVLN